MRLNSFKYGYVAGFFVGIGFGVLIFQKWYGLIPLILGVFLHGPGDHMSQIEVQELDQKRDGKEK